MTTQLADTNWPTGLQFPLFIRPELATPGILDLHDLMTPQGLQSGLQLLWHPDLLVKDGRISYRVDLAVLIEPGTPDTWQAASLTNAACVYWGQVLYRLLGTGSRLERIHTVEAYADRSGHIVSASRVVLSGAGIASSSAIDGRTRSFALPILHRVQWTPLDPNIRAATESHYDFFRAPGTQP